MDDMSEDLIRDAAQLVKVRRCIAGCSRRAARTVVYC